jgi:hypothetical protein
MIDFKNDKGKLAVLGFLLMAAIILIIVQALSANTASKLEISLISSFQFIFSIAFTWILSQVAFESSYKEKQKKFAIGAFRRIKEIERNVKRTQDYIEQSLRDENDHKSCLKVAKSNLTNAQDTINSSIADWADIIEDEIEISLQIDRLETGTEVVPYENDKSKPTNPDIEELSKKLPPSLRTKISVSDDSEKSVKEAVIYLRKLILEDGYLDLRGFWEPRDAFMKDLSRINVSDNVYVARGITNNRTGAILLYDDDGNSLAVVTNRTGGKYDTFADALDAVYDRTLRPKIFGGQPVQAEVIEIEEYDPKIERQYIKVRVYKKISRKVISKYPEIEAHNMQNQPDA